MEAKIEGARVGSKIFMIMIMIMITNMIMIKWGFHKSKQSCLNQSTKQNYLND